MPDRLISLTSPGTTTAASPSLAIETGRCTWYRGKRRVWLERIMGLGFISRCASAAEYSGRTRLPPGQGQGRRARRPRPRAAHTSEAAAVDNGDLTPP